jgi:hypothetical protein
MNEETNGPISIEYVPHICIDSLNLLNLLDVYGFKSLENIHFVNTVRRFVKPVLLPYWVIITLLAFCLKINGKKVTWSIGHVIRLLGDNLLPSHADLITGTPPENFGRIVVGLISVMLLLIFIIMLISVIIFRRTSDLKKQPKN